MPAPVGKVVVKAWALLRSVLLSGSCCTFAKAHHLFQRCLIELLTWTAKISYLQPRASCPRF